MPNASDERQLRDDLIEVCRRNLGEAIDRYDAAKERRKEVSHLAHSDELCKQAQSREAKAQQEYLQVLKAFTDLVLGRRK